MKYYAQMIISTASYSQYLDQPEEIEKKEFTQKNINEWCKQYAADTGDSSYIDYLGFVLTDEDANEIETLYYRERRADYHGSHKTTH